MGYSIWRSRYHLPDAFFPLRYLTPIDSCPGIKIAHRADIVPRAMDVMFQVGLEVLPTLSILAPNKVQGDRRRENLCAFAACIVNIRRQCEDLEFPRYYRIESLIDPRSEVSRSKNSFYVGEAADDGVAEIIGPAEG